MIMFDGRIGKCLVHIYLDATNRLIHKKGVVPAMLIIEDFPFTVCSMYKYNFVANFCCRRGKGKK
jgi:hypothetical protein